MLDWNMFHEEIMPLDHVGIGDLESDSSTCQFEHGLGFVTRWAGKTCVVLPRWGLKPETKIIRGGYDEWTTNDIDYVHYYQAGPAMMHLPFHGPEDFTTWTRCHRKKCCIWRWDIFIYIYSQTSILRGNMMINQWMKWGTTFSECLFSFTFSCDVYWTLLNQLSHSDALGVANPQGVA